MELVFAYLDPGTGATLVQLALAGTAGVAAAAKLRMNKLKRRVAKEAAEEEQVAEGIEETAETVPTAE
ncbi:MAG: hypothetical protein QNJ89_07035 [Acidimicrobiia bacterium]|nr:hypothetical protein [Acidimicrobiia bacterium]